MARTRCVGIVVYKGNSVLLVEHTEKARLPKGCYNFPAGRVEEGENMKEAAVRELQEETGLRTSVEYLGRLPQKRSTIKMKRGYESFVFQPFICTSYSGKLTRGDKTIPKFVKIKDLDNLILVSEDIKSISRKWYKTSRYF